MRVKIVVCTRSSKLKTRNYVFSERAPKSVSWALGDALEVFPSEVPDVGAAVHEVSVYVDGVVVATASDVMEALLLWAVALFVFSLKYSRFRSTGRYIAHHILGVEDEAPKDSSARQLHAETQRRLSAA